MIIMVGRAHLGVSQDGHPHDEPALCANDG